jgi:hypothetical protein
MWPCPAAGKQYSLFYKRKCAKLIHDQDTPLWQIDPRPYGLSIENPPDKTFPYVNQEFPPGRMHEIIYTGTEEQINIAIQLMEDAIESEEGVSGRVESYSDEMNLLIFILLIRVVVIILIYSGIVLMMVFMIMIHTHTQNNIHMLIRSLLHIHTLSHTRSHTRTHTPPHVHTVLMIAVVVIV